MDEQVINVPEPGSFALFARIRPECKYAYQNPRDGQPFPVRLDSGGLWAGNQNEYAIYHLGFSWWCEQIGELIPINLLRGNACET
ncbi:MAG: hypothetical protein V7739_19425 [Motiliproteus sp.]